MAKERNNPYGAFNFIVDFPGGAKGAFSEVSGIDTEQGVIEYRNGNEDTVMRKLPGIRRHPHLVLKRGIIGKLDLWKWRDDIVTGKVDTSDVTVHLQNEKHEDVAVWHLTNAWPMKWAGPALGASKNETAIETL